jgi:hypothetical protein
MDPDELLTRSDLTILHGPGECTLSFALRELRRPRNDSVAEALTRAD